jgi:hypothetical protein
MTPVQWLAAPAAWLCFGGWLPALEPEDGTPWRRQAPWWLLSAALLGAAFGIVWALVHGYALQLIFTVSLWGIGQGWRPLGMALEPERWWVTRAGLLAGSAAALALAATAVLFVSGGVS